MKRIIVIIGGGAMGCCTAYFLTRHPSFNIREDHIIIIEANDIASSSSGKGGGLIARWAEPECLARPSFLLHQELADVHDGKNRWGYRRVTCADCKMDTTGKARIRATSSSEHDYIKDHPAGPPQGLDWIDVDAMISYKPAGTEEDTAQCDPFSFTNALFKEAQRGGTDLFYGTATKIDPCDHEARFSVEYFDNPPSKPKHLLATHVVIAAGPWSSSLTPEVSVSGARSHSLILRPKESFSNNLLFTDITYTSENQDHHLTTEIIPRPDGTVYACESSDPTQPLPPSSADVAIDPHACDRIFAAVTAVSPPLRSAEVERKQVCYLPIVVFESQRRKLVGPFLGQTSAPGVYIACGHDCWSISNAPATGKALSELIFDGESVSVDIESLSIRDVMSRARG